MVVRRGFLIIVSSGLAGCASYQEPPLQVAISQAQIECSAVSWPTVSARVRCIDEKEGRAWATYAPGYERFFEAEREKRDQLAAQFDAGKITSDQFNAEFGAYKRFVVANLEQQLKLDAATQENADQAAAVLIQGLTDAAAAGAVAYGQARAAQTTNTQHTTCWKVIDQLQCTTTNY